MSDLGNWAEQNLNLWLAGKTPGTQPTEWNIALYSGDPTDGGSATEVTGTASGPPRQTLQPADMTVTNGIVTNDNDIDYGQASVDWNLFDTAVAIDQNGNILNACALDQQYDVDSTDSFKIDANDLDFELK